MWDKQLQFLILACQDPISLLFSKWIRRILWAIKPPNIELNVSILMSSVDTVVGIGTTPPPPPWCLNKQVHLKYVSARTSMTEALLTVARSSLPQWPQLATTRPPFLFPRFRFSPAPPPPFLRSLKCKYQECERKDIACARWPSALAGARVNGFPTMQDWSFEKFVEFKPHSGFPWEDFWN